MYKPYVFLLFKILIVILLFWHFGDDIFLRSFISFLI